MTKEVTHRVALLLASSAFALLAAEAALRILNVWVGRYSDTMFTIIEHDDRLGWRMVPGIRAEIDLVDTEDVPIRSNSDGFFDDEFPLDKREGICRIAFLGDSMTWGFVREEERFSELVAASNPAWESLNFGMGGYGTDQSLLAWRYVARQTRPDLVILTLYPNDYADNASEVVGGRRKPYFELHDGQLQLENTPVDPTTFWDDGILRRAAPPYEPLLPGYTLERSRVLYWLAKNSDLARALYTWVRYLRSTPEAPPETPSGASAPGRDPQVDLLTALVEELAAEVGEAGARFAVVLAGPPIPWYEIQRSDLRARGIRYLDATAPELGAGSASAVLQDGGGHLGAGIYYRYNKHWNTAGNREVAALLTRFIRDSELCPPGDPGAPAGRARNAPGASPSGG